MIYNKDKKIITASEGMVLTNGSAFSSPGGEVYLGVNNVLENWYEITEDEYNEILLSELREEEEFELLNEEFDEDIDE